MLGFPTFAGCGATKEFALKPLEEASEVHGAFDNWEDGVGDVAGLRRKLVDECADTVQAVANLLAGFGVTEDEWGRAVTDCIARNERRGRY